MQILGYTSIQSIAEKNEMAKLNSCFRLAPSSKGRRQGQAGCSQDGRSRVSLSTPVFTESLTGLSRVDFLSTLYWGDGGFQGFLLVPAQGSWVLVWNSTLSLALGVLRSGATVILLHHQPNVTMAVSLSSLSKTRDLGSAERSREWSLKFFFFFMCQSH